MGDFIYSLLNSYTVVPVLLVLCLVFFVFFVAYALSKEGRDERGRGAGQSWGQPAFMERSACLSP